MLSFGSRRSNNLCCCTYRRRWPRALYSNVYFAPFPINLAGTDTGCSASFYPTRHMPLSDLRRLYSFFSSASQPVFPNTHAWTTSLSWWVQTLPRIQIAASVTVSLCAPDMLRTWRRVSGRNAVPITPRVGHGMPEPVIVYL